MAMMRTLRKLGKAAIRAVSVLYVALCLCWSAEICLCDPDPDNCGEHCHECDGHTEDDCLHLSVDVDDFLVPQTGVPLPSAMLEFFSPPPFQVVEISLRPRLRPLSTAPPDCGGKYVSYSARLHPLS